MTDRSLGQGLPGDWDGARSAAREPHYGAVPFWTSTARVNGTAATASATASADRHLAPPAPPEDADAKGFLGALFDFGFTSFVTPAVIKVLYVLIMIGTVVSTLAFTIVVFKASAAFGIVVLFSADPLIILIVMAIFRIFLEFFAVIFRAAEDIRALREHRGAG
jgi:hypothetical protein